MSDTIRSTRPRPMLARALSMLLMLVLPGAARAQTSVASDSAAVVATVHRLFDAMARRDTAAARALLLPGSQFVSLRPAAQGTMPRRQADTVFLHSLATGNERLLERIWTPAVHVHGSIAAVWAPYDFHVDGRFSHCGVDEFTLLRTGAGWQIAGIVYTVETTGCATSPLGPPPR